MRKSQLLVSLVAIVLPILCSPSFAETKEQRHALIFAEIQKISSTPKQRATPELIKLLEAGAAAGDGRVQAVLGTYYEKGDGVKLNLQEAIKLYRSAAELGDSVGQANLGRIYSLGIGAPHDEVEAAQWFRKAANQGHLTAITELAKKYMNGLGVSRDLSTAVSLFQQAAERNDPAAQLNLAFMYNDGIGVKKNPEEAFVWFRRAAEQNYLQAQSVLGIALIRDKVASNYPEALKWLHEAARQDDVPALLMLGLVYQGGHFGVKKDYSAAIKWYEKAKIQGSHVAEYELGRMYENGLGVERNEKRAYFYYADAAYHYKPAAARLTAMNKIIDAENAQSTQETVKSGCQRVYETEPASFVTNVCDYNNLGPTNCRDVSQLGTKEVARTVCNAH